MDVVDVKLPTARLFWFIRAWESLKPLHVEILWSREKFELMVEELPEWTLPEAQIWLLGLTSRTPISSRTFREGSPSGTEDWLSFSSCSKDASVVVLLQTPSSSDLIGSRSEFAYDITKQGVAKHACWSEANLVKA